jgi:hypothetical protein
MPKMQKCTDAKIDYAKYHGYDFIIFEGGEKNIGDWAYYSRIHSAKKILLGRDHNNQPIQADWIVYLDGDAVFAEKKIPLEAVIDIAESFAKPFVGSKGGNNSCEFIAQVGN